MHTRETPLFYSKDKVKIKCSQVMSDQAQIEVDPNVRTEAEYPYNPNYIVSLYCSSHLARNNKFVAVRCRA